MGRNERERLVPSPGSRGVATLGEAEESKTVLVIGRVCAFPVTVMRYDKASGEQVLARVSTCQRLVRVLVEGETESRDIAIERFTRILGRKRRKR